MGIGYDNLTLSEAIDKSLELIKEGRAAYLVTPNPEIVWDSRTNEALREAINQADMVTADGIGIIYAAKILGTPLKERVTGYDLATALMERLSRTGGSVFFFGAKPGVAERAAENVLKMFPGLNICGTNDGYFTDDKPIVDKINAASPDLLLVCLGGVKQELWMQKHRGKLSVGLMMGIGGVLDHYAGDMKRASDIWIRLNLEWLQRLITHPSRIKRMIKLPKFLLAVIMEARRNKSNLRKQ
jgi:N-acetylglucosaminyldiphosphoundecaprenol N-acetyl-beta-D-mannosaminyltransferase